MDIDENFFTSHGHDEIVKTKRTRADFDVIRMELMMSLTNNQYNYSIIIALSDYELLSLDLNILAKSCLFSGVSCAWFYFW